MCVGETGDYWDCFNEINDMWMLISLTEEDWLCIDSCHQECLVLATARQAAPYLYLPACLWGFWKLHMFWQLRHFRQ